MIRVGFAHLRTGDVVRLTNPNQSDVPQDATLTVVSLHSTQRHGTWIHTDDEEGDYYEDDGYDVELISYAYGLPDANFITWTDPDAGPRVAIRLAKNQWSVDGHVHSHVNTIALVNGAEVRALTERN